MNFLSILSALKAIVAQLKTLVTTQNLSTPQGDALFQAAASKLGTDASPNDLVPDEFGCAETVTDILRPLFPDVPVITGTSSLFTFLKTSPNFSQVFSPLPGDIIISPTGFGGYNGVANGHVGIVGQNGVIMSNDSYTGSFSKNYTLDSWNARYRQRGGYPVFFFRRVMP